MEGYAIRSIKTHRYFKGYSFSRLENDEVPTWGEPEDTSCARTFSTREAAERYQRWGLDYGAEYKTEVVEV